MKPLEVDVQKVPIIGSQRWVLAVMALFGKLFLYVNRVNLSVTILCMVKSDDVTNGNLTSSYSNVTDDACENLLGATAGGRSHDRGEFTWDKGTQSRLLAMYFYGYVLTQIPGGWLASRYGGKRVWGVCQLIGALCTLATPICARTNLYLTYALRFVLGFAGGVTFPSVHSLLGRWTPPFERSKLATYTFTGPLIGILLTFSISGVLCDYGFDNGWASVFYLSGIFNLIWVILWFLLIADSPEKQKRITPRELEYIRRSIGKGVVRQPGKVPWLAMARSGPLWATILGHVGNNYVFYTLLTSLPMFMKESLKFDIKQNGILSSLPNVSQIICSSIVGYVADTIREKRWLTTKTVRKMFQASAFAGVAVCMLCVGNIDCSNRYVAVFVLCLSTCFLSGNRAGYIVNHLDLAPSYAGVLFGITNTFGTIPGMIAPLLAGALTPNKTADEWRNVFYVCAGVAITCAILYLLLADGELQPWANPELSKTMTSTVTYHAPVEFIEDSNNPPSPNNGVDKADDREIIELQTADGDEDKRGKRDYSNGRDKKTTDS